MKRALIASIVPLFLAMAVPRLSAAAVLSPATITPTVSVGSTLTVDLRLDSGGEVINAVEAVLRYDRQALALLEVSRGGSFLTLWAEEPRLVRPGEVALAGGIPDGSFVVGGRVVSLTFKALQAGQTSVSVEAGQSGVYLHDGFGTPAALTTPSLALEVKPAEAFVPQLTSTSHPDASRWSSNPTFLVSWLVQPSTVVSYLFSRDPRAEPDEVIEENTGFTSFPNLTDGIWYFSLRERLSGEAWGPLARREVRIDTTPPEPFSIDIIRDDTSGKYLVSFAAFDRMSGVASYLVRTVRTSFWRPWVVVTDEQAVDGAVTLDDLKRLKNVTVMAVDEAGNVRASRWVSPSYQNDGRLLVLLSLVGLTALSLLLLALVRTSRLTIRRGRV